MQQSAPCIPLPWAEKLPIHGSERGGNAAASIYTLIETAKLNNIDPQAWHTDVLRRIADHKFNKIDEALPLNYGPNNQ